MDKIPYQSDTLPNVRLHLDSTRQPILYGIVSMELDKQKKEQATYQEFADSSHKHVKNGTSILGDDWTVQMEQSANLYQENAAKLQTQKDNIAAGYMIVPHYRHLETDYLNFWIWAGTNKGLFDYGFRWWTGDMQGLIYLASWFSLDWEIYTRDDSTFFSIRHKPIWTIREYVTCDEDWRSFIKRANRLMLWVYRSTNIKHVPKISAA